MKIVKEFYKKFRHRGYPVEIKEVLMEMPQIAGIAGIVGRQSPQQQMRKRCFIDNQDATSQMEPGGPATLDEWEEAARSYIDAVLDSMRSRQV